jgi:hypothetical protein
MTEVMPLSERLTLIANVSDLMLAGSIHAYRPDAPLGLIDSASTIHDQRQNQRQNYRMAA